MGRKVKQIKSNINNGSCANLMLFSIIHANVRSIKKHGDDLGALGTSLGYPNILCLNETWLSDQEDHKVYNIGRCSSQVNSRKCRGGGTMVQMKADVIFIERLDTELPEATAVQVSFHNRILVIISFYVQPRADKKAFISVLDLELERLSSLNCPIILAGDTNINTLDNNNLTKDYLEIITYNGFEIHTTNATRVGATSATCIDHFITKNLNEPQVDVLDNDTFSDHFLLQLQFKLGVEIDENKDCFRDMSLLKNVEKIA